jgi:hypothetical protein
MTVSKVASCAIFCHDLDQACFLTCSNTVKVFSPRSLFPAAMGQDSRPNPWAGGFRSRPGLSCNSIPGYAKPVERRLRRATFPRHGPCDRLSTVWCQQPACLDPLRPVLRARRVSPWRGIHRQPDQPSEDQVAGPLSPRPARRSCPGEHHPAGPDTAASVESMGDLLPRRAVCSAAGSVSPGEPQAHMAPSGWGRAEQAADSLYPSSACPVGGELRGSRQASRARGVCDQPVLFM